MTRAEFQTAEMARFRLLQPCDPEVYEDCTESHHYLEDGVRVDVTDYGRTAVFRDNATGALSWYIAWTREHIETWPGTNIVALGHAELS